jgi:hypothetical protein
MSEKKITDSITPDDRYCLFIGAGFSKWAMNLPTAAELFDYKIQLWGIRESKKFEELKNLKNKWDAENPLGKSEEFIRFMIEFSEENKKIITWYIGRRLAEPFIVESGEFQYLGRPYHSRRVMMIDDSRRLKIEGIQKAKLFIDSLLMPSFVGIITTNYDLLIEYTLGTKRFHYGKKMQELYGQWAMPILRWREGPVILKGELPLIKLHGSLNLTEKGYCTDGRGGITGKSIIIPPTQNKKIMDAVSQEWKCAEKILESSNTIIFFGFAFNQYDLEILKLLKKTGPWIKKVILINRNSQTIHLAKQIWPSAEIIFHHPEEIESFIEGIT